MTHASAAAQFIDNEERTDWHDASLWWVRQKRDMAAHQVPEWEQLRELASQIKLNVLSELDDYLVQFEANAKRNGVIVHWAADAQEHNEIVLGILRKHQYSKMVKSKSMLTEECHLNSFLVDNGIEVIDTDLGERIVQLEEKTPSHIVMPAIHMKKEEIGVLFHNKLGTEAGNADPQYLTEAARGHLRSYFLKAEAALTGVNFAIADTGGVVVCTNEGNADMGVHLAKVQIHSMGMEKIIPRAKDLGIFTRLLSRSATGQPITVYTAHHHRPRPGSEMHIIIVDNGRSKQLGRPDFRKSLACIRCGACMNTCPIYRRSGGHSYDYTIPGPIGSILTPGIDLKKHKDLPFASTLCGSCADVCPVKIDIHHQLYKWRQVITEAKAQPAAKTMVMQLTAWIFKHPFIFRIAGKMGRLALKIAPRGFVYNRWNGWGLDRELPVPPKQSFREWYLNNRKT